MIKSLTRLSHFLPGVSAGSLSSPRAMASMPRKELQASLIRKFNAQGLAEEPYHNDLWRVSKDEYLADAKKLADTVRVFYLPDYVGGSEILKTITHVPYICTSGDSYIQTQDQKIQPSLEAARKSYPDLISNNERRVSRGKCIASVARCYAIGGYKTQVQPLPRSDLFDCIVVSGAGPQFEAPYLDYADFILTEKSHGSRLKRYGRFGKIPDKWKDIVEASKSCEDFVRIGSGERVFHKAGYLVSMTECMHLWLTAFDQMIPLVSKELRGFFKISAIGCGFFSDVAGASTNIGTMLMPILVQATEAALEAHSYPNLARIEFCDFSKDGSFAPSGRSVNGVDTTHGPRSDVLDFSRDAKESYVVGLLNPSDCFACVGNETRYLSVESMIGDNTTIRHTQCYIWNSEVLEERNYIEVTEREKN